MVSTADIKLIKKIEKEGKSSSYEFIYGIVLFLLLGTGMYFRDDGTKFLLEICILALLIGIYLYSVTLRKSNIINRTILEIKEVDEYLILQSANFKFFSFINKKGTVLNINKNDLNLKTSEYPISRSFGYIDKALVVVSNEQEFYILTNFFEFGIENNLRSFNHNYKK